MRLISRRRAAPVVTSIEAPRAVDLSSNDYLGLRAHPRVRAAAVRAIERYGVGSGGARDVGVGGEVVEELEARLARFKCVPHVRMVQSGYAANIGLVPLLVGPGDAVVLDRQNHPSSHDGARLSGAAIHTYPHADLSALESALRAVRPRKRRLLVITDGVFGLSGDIAPLPSIVEIAERHGALVMVDDAHGSGVLGGGKGTVAHFGLGGRVTVEVATASKALGVVGGFVAMHDGELGTRLAEARTMSHSTALPPHLAAACLAALDVLESEPGRVERLWANRSILASGLREAGLDSGASQTPIVPVITGTPNTAVALGERIREHGVCAAVFVPPKVAKDESRLRLIATATYAASDMEHAVSVIARAASDLGIVAR